MKSRALGVVCMGALVAMLPGCLDRIGGCDGFIGGADWTQPGLYERFPPPGTYGKYEVDAYTSSQNPNPSKDADLVINSHEDFGLTVYRNANVSFLIHHPKALTQTESFDRVEQMYRDLKLGDPPPEADASFHWSRLCG